MSLGGGLRHLICVVIMLGLGTAYTVVAQANSCLSCHSDGEKMQQLGYPHFTVSPEDVRNQTGMPAGCTGCHLGNSDSVSKEEAHKGMGRLLLVRKKGLIAETTERKNPLEVTGNPMVRIKQIVDREGKKVVDPTVNMVLYQDKRSDTLSQNFAIMGKTCGTCHARQFKEFQQSNMARNAKQSRYQSWDDKEHSSHNCGVWFGDNYAKIAANTNVPFSQEQNALNQRACNTCHVGCLDCHYDPQEKKLGDPKAGMHTFNRTPKPESCYGGGRGQVCHAGPEERRRGAGYFGGSYSNPEGMEPDIHLVKKVACLDCHDNSRDNSQLGHATIKRQARCDKCHESAVRSHAASLHRNLSCEACHISKVGGYQGTYWGPGKLAGVATPFFKYKEYYGIMAEPILIRDQKGRWIPVKPFPMAVMNQKAGPDLKPGLHWRWPKELPDLERTDDAWGYVGVVDSLPDNNKAILWIQMDKLSHKYGKSRTCDSCHAKADGEQLQRITWDFSDAGAFPFSGSHTVIANREGLFIRGIKTDDKPEATEGHRLSSLAPWLFLPNSWFIKGDFSLPPLKDRQKYSGQTDQIQARKTGVIHH